MADPNNEEKGKVDIDKILLPKKEVHTSASAERINAGVLLAQEQQAGTEGLKGDRATVDNSLGVLPHRGPEDLGGSDSVPLPPPKPKKDESIVKSIQTYKSDVESLVEEKNVSVVSIAAAEAKKRERAPIETPVAAEEEHWIFKRVSVVIGGVLLITIAAGALAYVLTRPTTVPVMPLTTSAPFINVDDTMQVSIDPSATSASIMQTLNQARLSVSLSLGLIERLLVTDGSSNTVQVVPIKTLLAALAPETPQSLIRTLTGQYILGVHSYDENQAFLILQTDSYETAYAAMLEWEPTMSHDLLPLFSRTPPAHIQNAPAPTPTLASTTATSTRVASSTTPSGYFAATTTAPIPSAGTPTGPLTNSFVDRVVDNRDARVLQTSQGDLLLLWTFLDRNTLVITTNDATLREVITRIAQAPTVPLPQ